jgi:hypothetical protein
MKRLPTLTSIRLERLKGRLPLQALSTETGISMSRLSMAERGRAALTAEEEARRRDAIKRFAKTGDAL